MKIFSNFDTKLRTNKLSEYQQEYGADNVLCFGRSKLYRWIKVLIPTVFLIALSFVLVVFLTRWIGSDYFLAILIVILVLAIFGLIPIIGKYLDYKGDFIIVIPSCMIMYDQGGILKRNTITISAQSIKTISIKKEKLLYSIFDNGDIIILTEGDVKQNGEVTLRWVPKPEKRRNQMSKLIGIDTQSNQDPH